MKGKQKIYFLQWEPALFKAETAHLTFVERSLYRCLIDDWWLRQELPNNPIRLALIAQLAQDIFDESWPEVSKFFYEKGDNNEVLGHVYLERCLYNCVEKSKTSSEAGKISGLIRKRVERSLNTRSTHVQRSCNHKDKDKDITKKEKVEKESSPENQTKGTIGALPQTPPSASLQAHPESKKSKTKKPEIDYSEICGLNLDAWDDWLQFRKAAKKPKYKTDRMAQSMAKYSVKVQAATIQNSIENEYQGLFPEKFTDDSSNGSAKQKKSNGNGDYGGYGNPAGYATPPDASKIKQMNDELVAKFRTIEAQKNPTPKKETKKFHVKPKVVHEKRTLATDEEFEKERERQLTAAATELERRMQND